MKTTSTEDLDRIVNLTFDEIRKLLIVKGGEYAGSEDRLGNFKRGASRVGIHPMQILWIYAAKHIDSIETFIRDQASGTDRPRSEPIYGRLDDLINYCLLLKALIQETSDGANETGIVVRDISVNRSGLYTGVRASGDTGARLR